MNCLVCNKREYPICKNCKKNPYRIEDCRNILAAKGDKKKLANLYSKNLPEIINLNSPKFWNNKLAENETISEQDGMTRERIKTVASFLPENAKKILDIGAGHGFLEEYLSDRLKNKKMKIFANDFSRESIKHLRCKYQGTFEIQSIYSLRYSRNFFDAIFVLEVLEHIPPSKILNVLSNIKSLLKKNGTLIVSVPTNEGLEKMKINHNSHIRMYTTPLIKAELEISGFNVERIKTLYAFDSYYEIKKILSRIFPGRWKPNNIIIKASI